MRARTFSAPSSRVLVVRRRYVGDLVLLEPFLRNLRVARPDAEITVVVDHGYGDVLRTCEWVDEILELPVGGSPMARLRGWVRLVRSITSRRFELAFDLARNERAAIVMALSRAKRRVSHEIEDDASVRRRRWSDRLRRRFLTTHLVCRKRADVVKLHSVDFNNLHLTEVGIEAPHRVPNLPVTNEDRERARELLSSLDRMRPTVLFHPGGRGEAKQWPPERLGAVADVVQRDLGANVVLTAGPGERALLERLDQARAVSGGIVLWDTLPLGVLYAVLAECTVFVGNDSGPAHLAEAVGTPTLTLFGATRPAMWRTLGRHDVCLQPPLPCGETCVRPGVCEEGKPRYCVLRITEEEVAEELGSLLARVWSAERSIA